MRASTDQEQAGGMMKGSMRFSPDRDGGNNIAQSGVRSFVFVLQLLFQPQHRECSRLAIAKFFG